MHITSQAKTNEQTSKYSTKNEATEMNFKFKEAIQNTKKLQQKMT